MLTPFRKQWLICAALSALLLLTYVVSRPALTGPFVFDDFPNLQTLAKVDGILDWPHVADYLQSFQGNPGRPLSALSFLINDADWPTSPGPFKRTNLLLHLLCGIFVFGMVRSLARGRIPPANADIAALLAAGAWLLHPIQLSTSMLVVQRMTQLMTLTSLAAVWWASAYVQRMPLTMFRSLWLLAVTAAATVIAITCKENGAQLPLYVLIACFVLLGPVLANARPLPRQLLLGGLALPVLGLIIALGAWMAYYVDDGLRTFTPFERVLTQPRVLLDYLYRIAIPRLSGSGLFHDDYVASRNLLDPVTTLPAVLACVGLIAAALALHRRAPLSSFATLWFFGGHLMESSPLPLELYFEHRNYLPMVGPLAAAAIWLASPTASKTRGAGLVAAIAWIALCAGMTSMQARVWSSETLLAGIWARENPGSARAVELYAKVLADQGRYDEAYEWIRESMAADPGMRRLGLDLVLIHCHTRQLTAQELAQAIADMRIRPFNRSSLEAVATLQLRSQQGTCAPVLTPDTWQPLALAMLANPVYRKNKPVAAFLWIEIAKSRIYQRRLDANDALEAAFAANPEMELALAAHQVMRNSGQCILSERWRARIQDNPTHGFDRWMQDFGHLQNAPAMLGKCVPIGRQVQ